MKDMILPTKEDIMQDMKDMYGDNIENKKNTKKDKKANKNNKDKTVNNQKKYNSKEYNMLDVTKLENPKKKIKIQTINNEATKESDIRIINPGKQNLQKIIKICLIIFLIGSSIFYGIKFYNTITKINMFANNFMENATKQVPFIFRQNNNKKQITNKKIVEVDEKQIVELREKMIESMYQIENDKKGDYGYSYMKKKIEQYKKTNMYKDYVQKYEKQMAENKTIIKEFIVDIRKDVGKKITYKNNEYLLNKAGMIYLFSSKNEKDIDLIANNEKIIKGIIQEEIMKYKKVLINVVKITENIEKEINKAFNINIELKCLYFGTTEK